MAVGAGVVAVTGDAAVAGVVAIAGDVTGEAATDDVVTIQKTA